MGFVRDTVGAITGSSGEKAAEAGAGAQMEAARLGVEEQRAAREQITQNLAPFRQQGVSALNRVGAIAGKPLDMSYLPKAKLGQLGELPSILPGDIGQDSLFQSLKRQAISGIEGSAAARGKLFSGSTPQAIAENVQNLAMARAGQIQGMNLAARQQLIGERGDIFSQNLLARQSAIAERTAEQERRYQQLFNVANLGQAAAAQQATNIQNSASNIANLLGQGANAYAAGQIGGANARADAIGNLTQAATTAALFAASDRRVKEDIKQVGMTDDGLPVYTFKYKGSKTTMMGVMAQDVEKKYPDAVIEINGVKHVNYGAL